MVVHILTSDGKSEKILDGKASPGRVATRVWGKGWGKLEWAWSE